MRSFLLALMLLAACGARTGTEQPGAAIVDVAQVDTAPAPEEPRLVFNLFDGLGGVRLYEVRSNGSGMRELRAPAARAVYPAFTREGRHLLYVALGARDNDVTSLVALDLRTRTTRTLVTAAGLSSSAVSPDGRTVAYTAGFDVRAINWDGSDDRLLVRGPLEIRASSWGYGHPEFGADSSAVFYSSAGVIERIAIDGTGRQTLIRSNFRRIIFPNVAVSPDGTRLAAGIACDETRALRVFSLARLPGRCDGGREVTAIETSSFGNQANNPTWGGDDEVALQMGRDVWVIHMPSGASRNVTAALTAAMGENTSAAHPAWVPRGVTLPSP